MRTSARACARYGASGNAGPSTDLARRLAPAPATASRGPADLGPRSTAPGRPGTPNDRNWNLALLNGYEYDTNVALAPSLTPLGLGATGKPRDSRYVLAAFGDYRLFESDEWILGLIGSAYSSFQFDRTQFNLQDYMGGAYSNLALGERFILGTRYEFHETLLNGHQFATDHRLTPNLTFREGTFGHTTAFYEYEALGVTGLALVPAQVRSGDIHSVGATQAIYLFEGAGRLFFGYRHDQASTAGSDFDRRTDMVNARIEAPLPFKSVGFAEYRHFWDDYQNPNSLDFFGRPRSDRRSEARVGSQTFFTAQGQPPAGIYIPLQRFERREPVRRQLLLVRPARPEHTAGLRLLTPMARLPSHHPVACGKDPGLLDPRRETCSALSCWPS